MRVLLLPLLFACTDDSDSGSESDQKAALPEVSIVSPAEGDSFLEGDSVHLEVAATVAGEAVEVTHAEWSTDGWARTGVSLDVTDLPAGSLTLTVDSLVDGNTSTSTVHITVEARPVDTDTGGGGAVEYRNGSFDATVTLSGDYDLDGPCQGTVTLMGDEAANTVTGTGSCNWSTDWGDFPMEFAIDGAASSGNLSGNLVMTYEGDSYATPYTGTGNVGSRLSATFDETYSVSGNSLRIAGSWSADPS